MFLELLVARFSPSLSRYLALPAFSAAYLSFLYLSLYASYFACNLCLNISIEPRFVVGVACYCFRWNTIQTLAKGDVIADCLCVFVNVGCGLFEHSPISAFKTPSKCLHCIH